MKSELVKPVHLARRAVVYIRQSTPHQVVSNQESLRLQYALRQRARELGWHEADIDVIDADLGRRHDLTTCLQGGADELCLSRLHMHWPEMAYGCDVNRFLRMSVAPT